MSNHVVRSKNLHGKHRDRNFENSELRQNADSKHVLAASITKAASKQSYYTIRFLVDRDRVDDAYRAYAYFRWVDDWLDQGKIAKSERIAFVERQQMLVECCYLGDPPCDLTAEEMMLVDLIRSDPAQNSGLEAYIRNLMSVMVFDAKRRGRLISQAELTDYSWQLSTAVTEALYYFIGHDQPTPQRSTRYLAATGAHIIHMLRDTYDDIAAGYFNIPAEALCANRLDASDVDAGPYREWVKTRVQLARTCFEAGKRDLALVKNLRCRIAGYAYIGRFEGVLEAIQRDGYLLRSGYPECKHRNAKLSLLFSALRNSLESMR
jgi:phytoene/squalene synthetase